MKLIDQIVNAFETPKTCLREVDATTAAGLRTTGGLSSVKRIELMGHLSDEDILEGLAGLKELVGLSLYQAKTARQLEPLSALPDLRTLYLDRAIAPLDDVLRAAAKLPRLETLIVRPRQASQVKETTLAELAELPLQHLEIRGLEVSSAGVRALQRCKSLVELELHARGLDALELSDLPALRSLYLAASGDTAALRRLPVLKDLFIQGTAFTETTLEDLPGLSALELGENVQRFVARRVGLCELTVGPLTSLVIEDAPNLRNLNLIAAAESLPKEQVERLCAALPGCKLIVEEKVWAKRKRGPKRTVAKGGYKLPRFGETNGEPHAVLVAGRSYEGTGEESYLKVATMKSLAETAAYWATTSGLPLACVPAADLTKSAGLSSSDTVPAPAVAGLVVGFVSAAAGKPQGISRAELGAAVARAQREVPAAFWQELAGLVGHSAFEELPLGLYLVASGPLAGADLAVGSLGKKGSAGLLVGQGPDQRPWSAGVEGTVAAHAGFDEDSVEEVELGALAKDAQLYLLARYD